MPKNGKPCPLVQAAYRAGWHPDTVMNKVRRGEFPAPIEVPGLPSRLVIFDEGEVLDAIAADKQARHSRRRQKS